MAFEGGGPGAGTFRSPTLGAGLARGRGRRGEGFLELLQRPLHLQQQETAAPATTLPLISERVAKQGGRVANPAGGRNSGVGSQTGFPAAGHVRSRRRGRAVGVERPWGQRGKAGQSFELSVCACLPVLSVVVGVAAEPKKAALFGFRSWWGCPPQLADPLSWETQRAEKRSKANSERRRLRGQPGGPSAPRAWPIRAPSRAWSTKRLESQPPRKKHPNSAATGYRSKGRTPWISGLPGGAVRYETRSHSPRTVCG